MALKRIAALCAALACSAALGQWDNLLLAHVGDDAAEAAFKALADLGGDGVAMSQKAARLADGFGADALDGAADFAKHISDAGLSGADALGKIMRLPDVSESRKIFEAAGSWADDAALGTAREACEGVAKWAAHADLDPSDITRVIDELSPSAAQGYFTAAGKTLGDGVANGIDRVNDSLAALKATPKTGGVDSLVAEMLDSTIPTMKDFHALRNLDPNSLTAAQINKLNLIRENIGTPIAGTQCQKVIKLDRLQRFLSDPNTKISGHITKYDDVVGLNTVDDLREGLRLDYAGDGYVGVDEVGIIEFHMPASTTARVPREANHAYPSTRNGFTGTRLGRAIPESAINNPFVAPEGTKLFWLDSSGNKVLFGTLINGVWVQ